MFTKPTKGQSYVAHVQAGGGRELQGRSLYPQFILWYHVDQNAKTSNEFKVQPCFKAPGLVKRTHSRTELWGIGLCLLQLWPSAPWKPKNPWTLKHMENNGIMLFSNWINYIVTSDGEAKWHIRDFTLAIAGDLGVPSGRPTMFFSVSFRETGLERQHMGPTPAYIFNDELGSFPQRRCSPNSVSANMVIPNPVMLFNSATMFQMPYPSSMNDAQIVPSNLVSTCKNRFLSPQSGT